MAPLMKKSERWQSLEKQAESQQGVQRVDPRELLISYARQNGLPAKEVVYEDSASGRGPRLLVSVSSVSTLRGLCEHEHAKHDQVVQKLNHCRQAYFKELRWLRDQLHLAYREDDEAKTRKAMMKTEDFNVFFFDQKNYVEPDSKEAVIAALEEEVHRLKELNSDLSDEVERQKKRNSVRASLREHTRRNLLDQGVEAMLHEMRGLLKSPGEQKTFTRVAKDICAELEVEAPPEVAPEVGPSVQEQEIASLREELEKARAQLIEVNTRMVQEKASMSVQAHDLEVQSERAVAEQKRADQAEEREKSLKRQFSELCQELTTSAEERSATAHRSVSRLEEVSQALANFKTPTAVSPAPSPTTRLSATVNIAAAAQVADGPAHSEGISPKRCARNRLNTSMGSAAGSRAASAISAVSRAVSTISAMSRVASAMSHGSFRSSDGFERKEAMQTMQQMYGDLDATIGRGESATARLETLSKDVLSELARLRESGRNMAEEAEAKQKQAKEGLAAARAEVEGLHAEVSAKQVEVDQLRIELSKWKEGAPIAPNQATVNFLNRELNGLQQKERVQQDYIEQLQEQLETELANQQQKDGERIATIDKLQGSVDQMHKEIDQWQEKDAKKQIEIDELRAAVNEMKIRGRLTQKFWERKALSDAAEKPAELGVSTTPGQEVREKQVAIRNVQAELEVGQESASDEEEESAETEKEPHPGSQHLEQEIPGKQSSTDWLHARVDYLQAQLDHWRQKRPSYERQLQVDADANGLAVGKTAVDKLDTNASDLQAELDHSQQNEVAETQATIDKLHIKINDLEVELDCRQLKESSHAEEIAADVEEIEHSSRSMLEQEACDQQATVGKLHAEVDCLQAELDRWPLKAPSHEREDSAATDKSDQSSQRMLEQEVREKQVTIDNLHTKVNHLQGELEHWQLQASRHAEQIGAATDELNRSSQTMLQEVRDKQATIDNLQIKIDHLQGELGYWQSKASSRAQQIDAAAEEPDQKSQRMLEQEVRDKQETIDTLEIKVVRLQSRVMELQRRRASGSEGTTEDEEDIEVPDPYYKLASRDSEKKQRWQLLAEDGPNARIRREALDARRRPSNAGDAFAGLRRPSNAGEVFAGLRRPSNAGDVVAGLRRPSDVGDAAAVLPRTSNAGDVFAAFQFVEDAMQHSRGSDAQPGSADDGPRGRSISKDPRSVSKDPRSFSKDRRFSKDVRGVSKDVRSVSKDVRSVSKGVHGGSFDASVAGQPLLERRRTSMIVPHVGMNKAGHRPSLLVSDPHRNLLDKPTSAADAQLSSVGPMGTVSESRHHVESSHPDVGSTGPKPVPADGGPAEGAARRGRLEGHAEEPGGGGRGSRVEGHPEETFPAGPGRGSHAEEPRSDAGPGSEPARPPPREETPGQLGAEPSAIAPQHGPVAFREKRQQRSSVPHLDFGHALGAAPSQGGLRPSSLDKLRTEGMKPAALHGDPEQSGQGLLSSVQGPTEDAGGSHAGGSQRRDRRAERQGTHRHLRAEPPPFRTGVASATTPEGSQDPGRRGGGRTPRREALRDSSQQSARQPLLGESSREEADRQPKQSEWNLGSPQVHSEARDQRARDVAPLHPATSGREVVNEVTRQSKPPRLLRARTEEHLSPAKIAPRSPAAELQEQREQARWLLNAVSRGRQGSNSPRRRHFPIRTIAEAIREEGEGHKGPSIVRSRSENFETRGRALTMTPRRPRESSGSPVRARLRSREELHRAEAAAVEPGASPGPPPFASTSHVVGAGHVPEDGREARVARLNGARIPPALAAVFERSLSQEREQREARPTMAMYGPPSNSGYPRGAPQEEQVGALLRHPTVSEPQSPESTRSLPVDACRTFQRNKLEPLEVTARGLSPPPPQPRGTVLAALKTPARAPVVAVPSPPRPSPTARDTAREMAAQEPDESGKILAGGQRRARRSNNAGFAARIRELSGGRYMTYKELQQRQQPFTNMGAASTRMQRGPQARSAPTLNAAETRSEYGSAGFLPTLSSPSAAMAKKGHKP